MSKKNKERGLWVVLVVVVIVVIIGGYFVFSGSISEEELGEHDEFTQCLVVSGVKMYGSVTCSVCTRQKELFGNSFRFIDEIECNPFEEDSQAELCLERGIEKTPTWILEDNGAEIQRLEGYQTLETLADISGCTL